MKMRSRIEHLQNFIQFSDRLLAN